MSVQLSDLLALDDELGFLTVTASFAPATFDERGPSAPPTVRGELRALLRDAEEPRREALDERLDEIGDDLEQFLDPSGSGRGRMLVAGLSGGDVVDVRIQAPLPTEVHLEDGPALRALLEVLDDHAPAGVLLLHRDEALLLHLELGIHEELASWAVDLGDRVFADEFYGPTTSAQSFRRGLTHREQRRDRIQANLDRFHSEVADDTRTAVRDDDLGRLVLVGPSHERSVVADALGEIDGVRVLHVDRVAAGGASGELIEEVEEALVDDQRAVELERTRTAIDQALSGGNGALGVSEIAHALGEGRVHHLLLTPYASATGYVDDNGLLSVSPDDPRLGEGVREEPRLVHRMIEAAMATDADVTVVDGEAAALLADRDEVAAVLRW